MVAVLIAVKITSMLPAESGTVWRPIEHLSTRSSAISLATGIPDLPHLNNPSPPSGSDLHNFCNGRRSRNRCIYAATLVPPTDRHSTGLSPERASSCGGRCSDTDWRPVGRRGVRAGGEHLSCQYLFDCRIVDSRLDSLEGVQAAPQR